MLNLLQTQEPTRPYYELKHRDQFGLLAISRQKKEEDARDLALLWIQAFGGRARIKRKD